MAPTAARSRVGTRLIGVGRQTRLLAAPRPSPPRSTLEVRKLSEPARRMAALPALRQSAPASAVTFGRLSKITPMTPSGVATRSITRPFGRSKRASTPPDGIGQRGDALDRPCDIFDPAFIERKSIDERRREPIVTGLRHVLDIRLQNLGCPRADRRRHGGERRVLLVGARQSESVGGPSSPTPQIHHLGPNLVGNARYPGFGVEFP